MGRRRHSISISSGVSSHGDLSLSRSQNRRGSVNELDDYIRKFDEAFTPDVSEAGSLLR